ncbi:helix-turn-helix domain-containing protein [Flavobacterium muglaense]|uniref:AraC family transcriptional regulator n=1 Tax=Flavobacterium muglaense TaxID=2764716 RepID=A0A923MYD1_9FLAO|nr:helix-turn-helix domain-containing protein [Flavobacterium muglaense]MBC5837289.1 AraC family transcriptional regulator [Flavobacterium muglaense]MBC5843787.1 AraC family transcriptional regulator [Flavobacterium muglaense]
MGEVNEALKLYKECLNYYKDKETRSSKYSFSYQLTTFALADAYKALKQTDSATYYNNLGYKESKITRNSNLNCLFVLNEGANLILKKNYKSALDSIDKALPKIILLNDQGNILAAYFYKAKTYDELKIKNEAVLNYKKVDSMYSITKRITPEFMSGYPYLIDYYKEKSDKENQIKYLQKYTNINKTLQNNYKELSKKLEIEYDIPHLISEKESLITSLKKEKKNSYWGIGGLILISFSVSSFGYYQYKLKKTYKSRFEKIINRDKVIKENFTDTNSKATASVPNNKKELGIAEELVAQIIDKLNQFETKNGFLQSDITVQILAEKTQTNSKYLSKIVNNFKEKTFTKYINDLRVEYAIRKLQQDKKLQNYTIQALALEFGFNNAESFSTAFYKKTGIKPTYFIENINKTKSID